MSDKKNGHQLGIQFLDRKMQCFLLLLTLSAQLGLRESIWLSVAQTELSQQVVLIWEDFLEEGELVWRWWKLSLARKRCG